MHEAPNRRSIVEQHCSGTTVTHFPKKKDIKRWEMTAPKTCPHSLPRSVEML